jgi:N-acyl-D-amino-acid deacylase
VLKFEATMIGSDGLPHDKHPRSRLWGTFPRVLGHYARNLGLFSSEKAVHRMTGLSARRFNLKERGEIEVGNVADLVVFDSQSIIDRATFADPTQLSEGIDLAIVGRTIAYANACLRGIAQDVFCGEGHAHDPTGHCSARWPNADQSHWL